MTAPTWIRSFSTLSVGLAFAAAAELALAKLRAPGGAFTARETAFHAANLALSVIVVAAAAALAWGGVTRALGHLERQGIPAPPPGYSASDFGAAGLVLAGPLVAVGAAIVSAMSSGFANRELSAVLAACSVIAVTLAAALATACLAVVARRIRTRFVRRGALLAWAPGIALSATLVGLETTLNVTGARQLDPRLLAAPAAAALAVLSCRLRPVRQALQTRHAAVALAAASLLAVSGSVLADRSTASFLAAYGAWGRPVVPLLRRVTDVDGDGYSASFGGGDCAPWNPRAHPGAVEVPANGVDDNCLGGDGSAAFPIEPPRPSGFRVSTDLGTPHVVLVTIETLRADHVSFLGYSRRTTPRLEELAAESVIFERLYAPTPTTRLSLPALLAGVLPSRIDWIRQTPEKRMRRIGPRTPWLPEILRQHGYATIAVHTSFRAFTQIESAGFDRGFELYDTSTKLEYSGGTMRGFPAGRQVDRALELVRSVPGRPLFLWVHLVEPHYLYEQPPTVPSFGAGERDLYDAEIREADRQVGRLLDALRAQGLLEKAVLLVAGDHGEEFGEHGERWHTSNLYEPQVRTAGLLRVPGIPARRLRAPVALTDFAPTLLDLLRIEPPLRRMHGRNLVPLLQGNDAPLPPFFLENFRVDSGSEHQLALVAGRWKLIHRKDSASLELYDVVGDPRERTNRYSTEPETARDLTDTIMRLRESPRAP